MRTPLPLGLTQRQATRRRLHGASSGSTLRPSRAGKSAGAGRAAPLRLAACPAHPRLDHVHLVLASASPARRATLRAVGIEPTVIVSDLDEDATVDAARTRHGPLDPADVALLLARAKCEAVAADLASSALVLGCDSVLELDGEAHGKPRDAAEATDRWRRMRGRSGTLHTGHWVRDERTADDGGTQATLGATASTTVHFAQLTDAEVDARRHGGTAPGGRRLHRRRARRGVRREDRWRPSQRRRPLTSLLRELLAEVGVAWFDIAGPPTR